MSAAVLEIEGLSAGYGNGNVVRGLDLTVRAGEVVSLIGPNGAGKTTTLRVVSGLLAPSAGSVRFAGQNVRGRAPQRLARLGMAHVMEGHSVFPSLTVDEHLRLRPRGVRLDRAMALDYFPALADLRNRRAGLLSGGEQQMLALAQALARRPELLLIDELSLGLAPVIVERLLPIIRRYADESGAAVVLVEQRVHLALEIADRGCLLVHGTLELDCPAEQLRSNSALITASYLGESPGSAPGEVADGIRLPEGASSGQNTTDLSGNDAHQEKENHVPDPLP